MARFLGKRHQSESVGYLFLYSMRRAYLYRSLYKLAEEAQSNKEFRHNLEKTLTVKEQQFIETADLDSLTRVLSDALNQGTRSQERHAELQQTIAKLGKSTVTFANNFSSFLQAYSGIVEIMQGADQQFGGAAYSVLSLLLVVSPFTKIGMLFADEFRSV